MEVLILRSLITGILLAICAAPMGCFMMWKNMAFYGAAIAHASILGLAIANLTGTNPQIGLMVSSVGFALFIVALQSHSRQNLDAQLSIVSHSMLALGLILLSLYAPSQINLMQYLIGDILSITTQDTLLIASFCVAVILLFVLFIKPLLLTTISPAIAQAEGINIRRYNALYLITLALFVSISIQVIGLLLVMAILIIPPAASKAFSNSPQSMIVISAVCGMLCIILGIAASWFYDLPAGPAIVVTAFSLYLISTIRERVRGT